MQFFESHAHYNDEKFIENQDELLKEIYEFGIAKIINVGYNLESSRETINLCEKYEFIYGAVGIHPSDIKKDIDLHILYEFAKHKKIVAIGEIGLDYYWNKENKEFQQEMFIKQIDIANNCNLPIIIHSRDAIEDTINIIKNKIKAKKNGVLHCCTLNSELIKEALKLEYYISFAGPITFKNSKNANEIIKQVPLDRLLIETDSPYLSPEPNRGKINNSMNLKYIAQKIADVHELNIEDIALKTYENTKTLFNITD